MTLLSIEKSRLALGILAIALGLAGCGKQRDTGPAGGDKPLQPPLRVTATTGMVADLVTSVGGDLVEVTQLMGAGVDPHLFKVSRDDVETILRADAVFYSGLMLEGKMADTLVKVGRSLPVFAVTELIDESQLLEPDDAPGHPDPHVWMDIAAWSQCVSAVEKSLTDLLPDHAEALAANAEAYRAKLSSLDAYAKEAIATIPEDQRILVTSHDAFNYFGRAYGLDVQGVQGLSTESEAGLRRINELVELLAERQTPAVFVESSVSPKNIQALIDGAASRGHEVKVGGELFSDAMGKAGTYEGTYLGMLDHNVTLVARGLGGDAPPCGHGGKLAECESEATP